MNEVNGTYFFCTICDQLKAEIIGIELENNSGDVLNVNVMEDTDKNGVFHNTCKISTCTKKVDGYTNMLMICRSCGNTVKPVSRSRSFDHS